MNVLLSRVVGSRLSGYREGTFRGFEVTCRGSWSKWPIPYSESWPIDKATGGLAKTGRAAFSCWIEAFGVVPRFRSPGQPFSRGLE